MNGKVAEAREFVRVAASRRDLAFLISKGKELLEESIAHTSVIGIDDGDWGGCVDTDWDSSAIAMALKPSRGLVIVGEDGDVIFWRGGDDGVPEKIVPDPVMIRKATTIGGYVFACGMKRQVYQRTGEANWVDRSAPAPTGEGAFGFEAIDGFSLKEIYAVGWNGEVWEFDGAQWQNRGGPTSVTLTAVCCAPNKIVYAAGQQGVLLRGRHGAWEVIKWEGDVGEDFWDLCWFNSKLFIATITGLYTLDGNSLVPVDFGQMGTPGCFSLSTAEGVLWSVGRDDVASFDGTRWRKYE